MTINPIGLPPPRRSPEELLTPRSPEDLFVTSLSVQGGETVIDREKTAFVRILLAGLRLENMTASNERRPVRQVAVLKLEGRGRPHDRPSRDHEQLGSLISNARASRTRCLVMDVRPTPRR